MSSESARLLIEMKEICKNYRIGPEIRELWRGRTNTNSVWLLPRSRVSETFALQVVLLMCTLIDVQDLDIWSKQKERFFFQFSSSKTCY